MKTEICSCKGLNAQCKKCLGSGYVSTHTSKKDAVKQVEKKKSTKKYQIEVLLPENLSALTKVEVEALAIKTIAKLDVLSKKQMQILNSIPFNTNTFRRDFREKFDALESFEAEKQLLRNDLLVIDQEIVVKNYRCNLRFKHFLSDKDVDVTSNRQLKDLIRAYKSLKNK